jgi:hypothetical protein
MFCSEKCLDKAMSGIHQFECNKPDIYVSDHAFLVRVLLKCLSVFDFNVKNLQDFLKMHKQATTVFDLDTNDPMYEKKMILLMLSNRSSVFDHHRLSIRQSLAKFVQQNRKLKELWRVHGKFLKALVDRICDVVVGSPVIAWYSKKVNVRDEDFGSSRFKIYKGLNKHEVGQAAYPFINILQHSCDENVKRMFVGNKSVLVVCKPIKKGREIVRSIIGESFSHGGDREERRELIQSAGGFVCKCLACLKNWPEVDKLPQEDQFFKYPSVKSLAPHDHAMKIVASNNAYVDRNFKEHKPTKEVYVTIENNWMELQALARPSFYP